MLVCFRVKGESNICVKFVRIAKNCNDRVQSFMRSISELNVGSNSLIMLLIYNYYTTKAFGGLLKKIVSWQLYLNNNIERKYDGQSDIIYSMILSQSSKHKNIKKTYVGR